MSITHFVPTIWSETLYQELQKNFVAVNHCNRDFEGEIKKKGSVVNICGLSDIVLKTYTKNSDITSPETLSDSATQLVIDQAKFFNFQIDDINRAQCSPKLMEAAMQRAAEVIANDADRHIFSLYKSAGKTITNAKDGEETLFDTILAAREYLYENNVGDGTELFLEVSPKVAARILKEKIAIPSTSEETIASGYLGSIFGCKIYVCNNVTVNTSGDNPVHNCYLRTKRAITFADQISEVEAYRPEKRFADAVKGLHLYGAKVVYPKEFVCIGVEF
jgi:hypothetical protein